MQIKSINLNEYQKNCTTGATSGVGKETARVLAKRGAHVIMAVRNTKAGEETKLKFLEEDPSATLDVMQLDLGSLASVRKFAGDFRAQNLPLNILMWVIISIQQSKCLDCWTGINLWLLQGPGILT
jgi:NAD(P)-dependent dehydrogenase (short-subunit alcohol dehydrogenase family)